MHTSRSHTAGFTLIEILITVSIVGILAAIAYPSYQDSVRRSWRTNAESCLMELAQGMERWFTTRSTYVGAALTSGCQTEGGMGSRYAFSFTTGEPTATTFIIEAAPVPGGPQASDSCGNLLVNEMGQKFADDDITVCWRR